MKSAAWDDTGVLVYTTLNHIKYCLPNGDSGIIRTLEVPVYITRVSGSSLHCLDRDGKTRQIQVSLLCLELATGTAGAVAVYITASHNSLAQGIGSLALSCFLRCDALHAKVRCTLGAAAFNNCPGKLAKTRSQCLHHSSHMLLYVADRHVRVCVQACTAAAQV